MKTSHYCGHGNAHPPLPEAFWEQLPQKSDRELYEVLLQPDDYLPEALEAVQEEIRRRHLPPQMTPEIAAEVIRSRTLAAEAEAQERKKRDRGRIVYHVLMALVIPLGLLIKALISLLFGP